MKILMRPLIALLIVFFLASTIHITRSFAADSPQWHLPDGAIAHQDESAINEIAYSPDGELLAVAGVSGIWLYDTGNSQEVARYTILDEPFYNVSFSPDGKMLAGGRNGAVSLWDVATHILLHDETSRFWDGKFMDVSFSPDSRTLAFTPPDYVTKMDINNRFKIDIISWSRCQSISFSPDGRMLAGGGTNGEVYLWDVGTGRLRKTLEGHTDLVESVSFNPNGLILASAGWDTTVRLWDVATGALRNTLEGHTYDVKSISISPNGLILASAGDQTVRLWSVLTGKHLRTLHGHNGWVNSVSFTPDSQTLASAGSDGKILLWRVGWVAADVNRDDTVNIQDLVIVAGALGEAGENDADVNGDGIVNIQDLVVVAGAFSEI